MNAEVMATKDEEKSTAEFDFDVWIMDNDLQEVKSLLARHKMTKQKSLKLNTPRFMALMADPQLVDRKPYMVPLVVKALQSIQHKNTEPRTRIVTTKEEEMAMNNASNQCDKVMKDMHKFIIAIENTKKNQKHCQQRIHTMFAEFIQALAAREKHILTQLDETTQQKVDTFQTQVNHLRSFRRQYNETKHKWDNMLYQKDMDREQRIKSIKDAANRLIRKGNEFKSNNQKVLNQVTEELDVYMQPYQSFVNGYGRFCGQPPTISELEVGSRTVMFNVHLNEEDHSDAENKENNVTYQVQWKSNDDDEKSVWEMRDFMSNNIEIGDLSPNTKYVLQCRIKGDNDTRSNLSKVCTFTTKKMQNFEINRVDQMSGWLGKWDYNGEIDALCFTSDTNIALHGIGVFDCKGTITAQYHIIKGDNDHYNPQDIVVTSRWKSFTRDTATTTPIIFDLDTAIYIEKDTKYTIQLKQLSRGGSSYFIYAAHTSVTTNDDVTITFSNAKVSPNETSIVKGALPILYCSL
eukprot:56668_1